MKIENSRVSGLALFANAFSQFVGPGETDSLVKTATEISDYYTEESGIIENGVENRETIVLGPRDRFAIAKLTLTGSKMLDRGIGLIHFEAVITATLKWFKRSGTNFYVIRKNEDGTLTAAITISFYRLKGLWEDTELCDDPSWPEWYDFWKEAQRAPYFDLFISRTAVEYQDFE